VTSRRIRVLHVVRNLNDGGMERVVADLARVADPAVLDMHVMTLGRFGRFANDVGLNTALHSPPRMTRLSLLRPTGLAAAIRRIAPDVVHTHSGTWYKVARAATLAGVPVVYTDHGRHLPDPWLNRTLDRQAARWTDRVVAVSRALGEYLVARLGLPRSRVEVITNGIDVQRLDAALPAGGVRRSLRASGADGVVFGTLGRIEPVKGYAVLLDALRQWPADAPRASLLIAGEGSERVRLEAMARRFELQDRVRFLGWIEQPERFYPLLDAFVLSSYSEGTSISLLEAMAARCPTVVTDVGGNREVLGDELGEWLVPAGDPGALAARMATVARSSGLRDRLGALARARIEGAYDLSLTAGRYALLYQSLLGSSRAASHGRLRVNVPASFERTGPHV
jgi:glycosyltransferase involved in cell wall biosynthesis